MNRVGRKNIEHGFTIVELLIVIVIIGILAAITIVAFNGIQNRARTSSVTSALSQAAKKLGVYNVDNGAYPATNNLAAAGVNNTSDVSYQYATTSTGYCVTATNGTVSYKITESTSPAQGGCAGHGVGGVAAIKNLINNPSFEANTNGWSYRWYGNAGGAGTNSRPTTGGLYGTSYLRKTWTVGGVAADNGFNTTTAAGMSPVTAGTSYTISGWMRTNRSDYGARIGVSWYDSAGVLIGASANWFGSTTIPANAWTRISQAVTPPAGAVNSVVYFSNGSSINWLAGDTLDLDGVMMNEGGVTTYADGNSTDWVWDGTTNNSTSTGPSP